MSKALTRQPLEESSSKVAVPRKGGQRGVRKSGGGVVSDCVHGTTGKMAFPPAKLVQILRGGLPVRELNDLQTILAVPMEKLVPMLGISRATLHRRKAQGRLDQAESDRVVRYARLMGRAIEVMESEDNARRWLTSPQFGLGGAVPLEYAETEVGAREVEDLLGRIEYGVYS